jgi:hypothetical protein
MTFEEKIELAKRWGALLNGDLTGLGEALDKYGHSWKQRGGTGAFMMLARKFDRIELAAKEAGWDIFEAARNHPGETGILDDIKDLRRYLLLVEDEIREEANGERSNTPELPFEGGLPTEAGA